MTLATYKFETIQVRTLGTAEPPLFVAIDVATALGYAVPKTAVAKVVDAEDIVKAEITDSMGRTQTVTLAVSLGISTAGTVVTPSGRRPSCTAAR